MLAAQSRLLPPTIDSESTLRSSYLYVATNNTVLSASYRKIYVLGRFQLSRPVVGQFDPVLVMLRSPGEDKTGKWVRQCRGESSEILKVR